MTANVDKSGAVLPKYPIKGVATFTLLVALSAFAAYVGLREFRSSAPAAPVANAAFMADPQLPSLTPEEEAYAAALWPIHSAVKQAAIRMTFAGLNYKTGDQDAKALQAKVQPLIPVFESAARDTARLAPPPTLADAHASYRAAIDAYAAASREMLKIVADGSEDHLLIAHRGSEQAGVTLLKLSDVLWPGEYKPN